MSAAKKTQRAAVEGNISVSRSWVADMELLAAQVSVAFRLPLTLDNARVIQAAPEMLEALRWLVAATDRGGRDPLATLMIAAERARDAIAKATGGES